MTAKKTSSKAGTKPLALALLIEDHENVDKLFKRYEKLGDDSEEEKTATIAEICAALKLHAEIEEEIFYPALREALGEDGEDTLDEAEVEHEHIKTLVEQLDGAEADGELVDARVTVLTEYVRHHVKEEEGEMFTQVEKARELDLEELGERMQERKSEESGTDATSERSVRPQSRR
jgi:hemerythrin-like domain-containing protein